MRFTVNREQLLKGLNMVSKAVPQKAELPIFQNVRMTLNEKGLELLGSDSNITIRTTVPYMVDGVETIKNAKPGSALINCKLLFDNIRKSESEFIDFELIDNSFFKITYDGTVIKPNIIRAEEYPDIDLSPVGETFDIAANILSGLVEQTAFSASNKEARPIFTGVNLEANGSKLTAIATDTARFAKKTVDLNAQVHFNVTIPAKKLVDITKSFEDADMVTVYIADRKAMFSFGNTLISTRLINAPYASAKNIIPLTFNYTLAVNAREFLNALDRVSSFGQTVTLIVNEDELELMSRSPETGSANAKISTFHFSGNSFEIKINPQHVSDAIRALGSEDVTFSFISNGSPFVVRNVKDASVDYLLTPYNRW